MAKDFIKKAISATGRFFIHTAPLAAAYLALDLFVALLTRPDELTGLWFTLVWSLLFASVALVLPRKAGRIVFGVTYTLLLAWSMTQAGYHAVFGKMMWLQDLFYIGEGVGFLGDTLASFPAIWWIGGILLIGLGVLLIWKFPERNVGLFPKVPFICILSLCLAMLFILPELIFLKDYDILGTRPEVKQSSSYRATYKTMYDAKRVYGICGLYQLTVRDVWVHEIYPRTPAYAENLKEETAHVREYFKARGKHEENEMTGLFEGKNVVLVLMESMDDWLITSEETPTLCRLMDEGINFTNFYTPGFGTARTLNTEFCINTGIYLPTTGDYVFDYVTNSFKESLAARAVKSGYSAQVFHYNTPDFYSRGVMEPAMGYKAYNSYGDYLTEENEDQIYDDCMLFDVEQLSNQFFRKGKTFNTIITRSAHLGYTYHESLSEYALSVYPEYIGKYGSEEEDCIRVKAKLVDDMFARLLTELKEKGQLENTVIIGVTDHYAYGMSDTEELMLLSGQTEKVMLERTPCFVWSADCPDMDVEKTLNTSDFLPTVLNLLGIESPYSYLGRDAFDPDYVGYALFPDGTWICEGVACRVSTNGETEVIWNPEEKALSEEFLTQMADEIREYIRVNNLLLTSDYYSKVR